MYLEENDGFLRATYSPKNESENGEENHEAKNKNRKVASTREAVIIIVVIIEKAFFFDGIEMILPRSPSPVMRGVAALARSGESRGGRFTGMRA